MKHKVLTLVIFIIVSIGFIVGYFQYNKKLDDNLNKVIIQDNSLEFNTGKENVETPSIDQENPNNDKEVGLKIPNLIGLKHNEAIGIVKKTQLKFETIEEYSAIYDEGKVFWQNLTADAPVSGDETLSYAVSLGAKAGELVEGDTITVPSVIGMTGNEAAAKLMATGFLVEYEYNANASYDDGTVYSQNYKVDAKVPKATTVIIRISTGN